MLSKKDKIEGYKISTYDKVLITPPTERFVLWVVANDSTLFNIKHLVDLVQKGLVVENKDTNLGKALVIFMSLRDRGYLISDAFNTKITFKGQLYRITTSHLFFPVLGVITLFTTIFIWKYPIQQTSTETKANQTEVTTKQQPITDTFYKKKNVDSVDTIHLLSPVKQPVQIQKKKK